MRTSIRPGRHAVARVTVFGLWVAVAAGRVGAAVPASKGGHPPGASGGGPGSQPVVAPGSPQLTAIREQVEGLAAGLADAKTEITGLQERLKSQKSEIASLKASRAAWEQRVEQELDRGINWDAVLPLGAIILIMVVFVALVVLWWRDVTHRAWDLRRREAGGRDDGMEPGLHTDGEMEEKLLRERRQEEERIAGIFRAGSPQEAAPAVSQVGGTKPTAGTRSEGQVQISARATKAEPAKRPPPRDFRGTEIPEAWRSFFFADGGRYKGDLGKFARVVSERLRGAVDPPSPHPRSREVAVLRVRLADGVLQTHAVPLGHNYQSVAAFFLPEDGDPSAVGRISDLRATAILDGDSLEPRELGVVVL